MGVLRVLQRPGRLPLEGRVRLVARVSICRPGRQTERQKRDPGLHTAPLWSRRPHVPGLQAGARTVYLRDVSRPSAADRCIVPAVTARMDATPAGLGTHRRDYSEGAGSRAALTWAMICSTGQ